MTESPHGVMEVGVTNIELAVSCQGSTLCMSRGCPDRRPTPMQGASKD